MSVSKVLEIVGISCVLVPISSVSTYADEFCATLDSVIENTTMDGKPLSSDLLFMGNEATPTLTTNPTQCVVSMSGQYKLACMWAFPFRADAAQTGLTELRAAIDVCVDDTGSYSRDQAVNHPDYYDAHYYGYGDHVLSASLKDKGALQQTLVFLRVKLGE